MTRTWLSIRVDLVEGRGERLWPRPVRIFAAARSHTFAAFATAIDDASSASPRSSSSPYGVVSRVRSARRNSWRWARSQRAKAWARLIPATTARA
jgi:hypothetical protein